MDNVDISGISSPKLIRWVFMFDRENANNHSNRSILTPLSRMFELILRFDVQQSIANIAVLGTVCAAVISGFATVFFPLEQLLIFRGVDAEQLRRREHSLYQLLREIATRKKELLMINIATATPEIGGRNGLKSDCGANYPNRTDNQVKLSAGHGSTDKDRKNKDKALASDSIDRDTDENIVSNCCSNKSNYYNLAHLNKNVSNLEELSTALFSEIIALKEQQHMSEMARTQWGRIMRFLGQILT
jgi:hypothetical protein